MRRISSGRIVAAIAFVALWVLLQGEWSLANLLGAAIVVGGVALLVPTGGPVALHAHPLGIGRFLVVVAWSLVTSSVQVMIATFFPTPERTAGRFVEVTLHGASAASLTLVANAISVTPGTLTIEADLDDAGTATLVVHVFGTVERDRFQVDTEALHRLALGAVTAVAHATATSGEHGP
ncbi:MAG: Na+/H+ antiporter subunit E [Actinobacteria bacterium]|nr:Na+/H+ antiporter subunit E [Actinomycetota bacterium]